MTEKDYNRVVKERPDLLLPEFYNLDEGFRHALIAISVERLIAGRTQVLLSRTDARIPEITSADIHSKYV